MENLESKLNLNIVIVIRVITRKAYMKQDLMEMTNYIVDNHFKKATRHLRHLIPNLICRSDQKKRIYIDKWKHHNVIISFSKILFPLA